jgi:hypothetical protein
MKPVEVIGMSIFGLLCVGALALGLYQASQTKKRIANYAALHGWSVSKLGDARLNALLKELAPQDSWGPREAMQVERPPESIYLFAYLLAGRGRSSSSRGNACLAEHTGRVHPSTMEISTRVPGFDKLAGDRVKAGGEKFREEFTVTCERPEEALKSVNAEVERILLEHAAGPNWNLSVIIAGRSVLVSSRWAETEQDWDHLIAMTRRLRAALR